MEEFIKKTAAFLENEKRVFFDALKKSSRIKLFPSTTSFILAKLAEGITADVVCARLSNEKILIRNCSNFKGLSDRFIRISLKTPETNLMIARKLISLIQT